MVKVGSKGGDQKRVFETQEKIQQFYANNEELYSEIASDERVPGNEFRPPITYISDYLQNIIFEDEATNFVKNSDERFHRWWPYLEGFSAEFVREVISELEIGPDDLVFDPFSGSGTTNLTCKLAGIGSVGIEINPTMHSILKSKLDWNIDLDLFKQALDDFVIPAEITQTPPSFLDNERQFNPGILHNLLGIKQYIKTISNQQIQQLFFTAFGSILLDCSNLKRSPSVGYTQKNYLYDEYPIEKFTEKIGHVYEDLCTVKNSREKKVSSKVYFGNSGVKILDPESVDFTITSPPYLNFFDYPGNYKIEMGWLEHVSSTKELKKIKDEMVPCDNISRGLVKEYLKKERIFSHEWLDYIETTVQANTDVRPRIRRKDFPGIIKKYFDDMALIIDHVAHATKKGGMFLLVVGDSLLTDVYVPTDILLIKIAEEYGFELETLKITRSRRSGIRRSFRLRETVAYLRKK